MTPDGEALRLVGLLGALVHLAWEESAGRTDAAAWDTVRVALDGLPPELSAPLAHAAQLHLRHIEPRAAAGSAWLLTPYVMGRAEPELKPMCLLPASAEPGRKLRWLVEQIAPYARETAVLLLFGEIGAADADNEMQEAATGYAWREGWPGDLGDRAVAAVWPKAQEHAAAFAEALRRAIYPLGRTEAGDAEIVAAAKGVNDRFGWLLPTDLLLDHAARIARGARPRRRRRVG